MSTSNKVELMEGQINCYNNAKNNIDNTIKKLNKIKGILEDKTLFEALAIDKIVVDIENGIAELNKTKTKLTNAVSDLQTKINAEKNPLE